MIDAPLGRLMADVRGANLTAADRELLVRPAVGAVILFARNFESPAQVKALIDEIKSLRRPALPIAVDQEGGRVQRFGDGFYRLPAAAAFGALYANDRARACKSAECAGALMAHELLQVGVDFSFAPVLDLANPQSQVIGDRAFHHAPDVVCELAGAFVRGMQRAGMAATGKHFPGHGGIAADSHTETPVDSRAMHAVENDLQPFARLAPMLGGVMTAHVLFENIDAHLPAFSEYWLKQQLRARLQFDGVIFSDDLSMQGAVMAGDLPTRTRDALRAGCDLALICNNPEGALQTALQLERDFPECTRLDAARLEKMRAKPKPIDAREADAWRAALDSR